MSSCLVILDGHQSHPVFAASCENDQTPRGTHRSICPVLFSPRDVPPPCFFMMPGAMSLSLDDGVLECLPSPIGLSLTSVFVHLNTEEMGKDFRRGRVSCLSPMHGSDFGAPEKLRRGGATGLHEPCCLHSLWVAIIQGIDNSVSVFGAG